MSPAPDDLSKDDLEEIIELTDVIEEGPERKGAAGGFEDELASLLDEPGGTAPALDADESEPDFDLNPPENPSAGRATVADLDELDDLFADLEKSKTPATPAQATGQSEDIESMLADIQAHAAESPAESGAGPVDEDLDSLLSGLEDVGVGSHDSSASEKAPVEEDQDLAAILDELEAAPVSVEEPTEPEAEIAVPQDDLDALLTAGLDEDANVAMPTAESLVRPDSVFDETPAEPAEPAEAEIAGPSTADWAVEAAVEAEEEAEAEAVEDAAMAAAMVAGAAAFEAAPVSGSLSDDIRAELAALREAQADQEARLTALSAAEARLAAMEERLDTLSASPAQPDPAVLLAQALGEDSELYAALSRRLSDDLAPRLASDLDGKLQETAADLRLELTEEMQQSQPAQPDPTALLDTALAEGSPFVSALSERLIEELEPRLQAALEARLEAALADRDQELASQIKADLLAELEALVPEAAAQVIREEIEALAAEADPD